MEIWRVRLTSAKVDVEAEAELGNNTQSALEGEYEQIQNVQILKF